MAKTKTGKTSTKRSAKSTPQGAFHVSSEPVVHGKTEGDVHKFDLTQGPAHEPAFESLGELPQSYGENTLFLIARDPHWLFSYWDIDWSGVPASATKDGERKIF